jgi:hypothetical protein
MTGSTSPPVGQSTSSLDDLNARLGGSSMIAQLELHPAWPELTDRQRAAVNEVWEDTVVPALEEVAKAEERRVAAVIEAQDARWQARHWQDRYDRLRWAVAIDTEAAT